MKISKNEIEIIIVYLIENDYLDESRFAKVFTGGKFIIKKWGKIRIVRELKYRKISDYNIKLALKEISNVDYLKVFNIISSKKIESLKKLNTQEKKRKLITFLTYKGWEKEMIYEKLNSF
ncbi:MAG: recombinase RecX [Flavobacteriaceae bacterium]|nr:recombinase RecX [Flavobacteriaceae bacterium]